MVAITWRACGELLCASTNSARSFSLGDCVPCRNFSSSGTACAGSESCQPLQRQQLQLLVGLRLGPHRLPDALAHLEFEGAGVAEPAARRMALGELRQRRQRVGLLPELALRVGGPVHRGVDPRGVGRHDVGEPLQGPAAHWPSGQASCALS